MSVATHASSTTPTTAPGGVTYSGSHSNPTPYVPSSQPIYDPNRTTSVQPASAPTVKVRFAPSSSATPTLAFSGSFSAPMAAVGGSAVLAGLGLVRLSRRRFAPTT